jgi:hypothetical protein
MTPEIASLMSNTSFWEAWGYVALLAVVVGVAGESIQEFTQWPKRLGIAKVITRVSVLVLVVGLAGEGITQVNTNAANALVVALLNKQAAELSSDLEKERATTSARPWTKDQFDAIQQIKGLVSDVGILWPQNCPECMSLASDIETALHSAGAQIYGSHGISDNLATGIFVRLPVGSDLNEHPLLLA